MNPKVFYIMSGTSLLLAFFSAIEPFSTDELFGTAGMFFLAGVVIEGWKKR